MAITPFASLVVSCGWHNPVDPPRKKNQQIAGANEGEAASPLVPERKARLQFLEQVSVRPYRLLNQDEKTITFDELDERQPAIGEGLGDQFLFSFGRFMSKGETKVIVDRGSSATAP